MRQMQPLFRVVVRRKFLSDPIGLYLHIPFCRHRCAYCDFYTACPSPVRIQAYLSRLTQEIEEWGGRIDRPIDTLYFGGGTPSLLTVNQLNGLMTAVQQSFTLLSDAEITLELNPDTADKDTLAGYRQAGVNRLSVGLQSGDDRALKTLGRRHTAKQGAQVITDAKRVGFDNISVDVMLGVPNSDEQTLEKTLQMVKTLRPEHLSAYMLILEENTRFKARREEYRFLDDEALCQQYLRLCERLREWGYRHYEISNFCLDEKRSRHNLRYWQDREYLGLGPSAYSFLDGRRFHQPANVSAYLQGEETVYDEPGGTLFEWLMLALRLDEGLNAKTLGQRYGKRFSDAFISKAQALSEQQLAEFDGTTFALTEKGMLVSNSIITQLSEEDLYENL